MIKSFEELAIGGLDSWDVIEYFSTVRLCPHCKRVSDSNNKPIDPWLYYGTPAKTHDKDINSRNLGNGVTVVEGRNQAYRDMVHMARTMAKRMVNGGKVRGPGRPKKSEKDDITELF